MASCTKLERAIGWSDGWAKQGQPSFREDFNCFNLVYFSFFSNRTLKIQQKQLDSLSSAWCKSLSLLFFFSATKFPLSLCGVGFLPSPSLAGLLTCEIRPKIMAEMEKTGTGVALAVDRSTCLWILSAIPQVHPATSTIVFTSAALPLPSPVSSWGPFQVTLSRDNSTIPPHVSAAARPLALAFVGMAWTSIQSQLGVNWKDACTPLQSWVGLTEALTGEADPGLYITAKYLRIRFTCSASLESFLWVFF